MSFRDWIEQTELKLIDYVLKGFDTSILDGAIKVRGGRQELAKPVSVSKCIYFHTINVFGSLYCENSSGQLSYYVGSN